MSIRPKTYFEKYYCKVAVYIIIFFIAFAVINNVMEQKEREHELEESILKSEQKEEERKQEEKRKKEEASKSVQKWIEYKNEDASYDEPNKALNVSLNFGRTLSISKRIEIANYSIYETTKEFEGLFKDDIDSYKFNFLAELVDNYGNKRKDVVYSIILNRNELNKVNWDGIQPSMLIDLASYNYKSPVLQ